MDFLQRIDHLLNFLAPALGVALLVAAFSWLAKRFSKKKTSDASVFWSSVAINFIVGAVALGVGAWVFGVDGKMLTYAALVLAVASSQWVLQRG